MKRTQIYLPENLYQELSWQSRRKNISLSELIRERISYQKTPPRKNAKEVFESLAKEGEKLSWEGTPEDLSCRIDEFVYG